MEFKTTLSNEILSQKAGKGKRREVSCGHVKTYLDGKVGVVSHRQQGFKSLEPQKSCDLHQAWNLHGRQTRQDSWGQEKVARGEHQERNASLKAVVKSVSWEVRAGEKELEKEHHHQGRMGKRAGKDQ